ncbi:MAG TPA: ABC transporter ATP-binding protein [Pseudonocardiaceae bacterium]|nr:ABC transporter ATP-binding protein [Pseudonocardiaceae bacterium]
MSELIVRGLTKSFGALSVLRGVDLTVPQGSLAAVLGPSGCGKTTLLRIVAGFDNPDAGEVVVGGRPVAGRGRPVPPERRSVGVVPQEGALFPHLSVAANVGFGLPRGRSSRARVDEMLELVGLGGLGSRMPNELSGGQQQRVAVARALAPAPALVLLDEPFSALDTGLRAAVREDVRVALHSANATAVLVTHDQQEALSMATLVAVLQGGRIVQAAPPADLYTRPADLDVASFVGEAVVLPATLRRDGTAECTLGAVPVAGGSHADATTGTVLLRPEQIVLGPAGTGVPARVTGVHFYGHDTLVELAVRDAGRLVARTLGHQRLNLDDEVGLTVTGDASFFPRRQAS